MVEPQDDLRQLIRTVVLERDRFGPCECLRCGIQANVDCVVSLQLPVVRSRPPGSIARAGGERLLNRVGHRHVAPDRARRLGRRLTCRLPGLFERTQAAEGCGSGDQGRDESGKENSTIHDDSWQGDDAVRSYQPRWYRRWRQRSMMRCQNRINGKTLHGPTRPELNRVGQPHHDGDPRLWHPACSQNPRGLRLSLREVSSS